MKSLICDSEEPKYDKEHRERMVYVLTNPDSLTPEAFDELRKYIGMLKRGSRVKLVIMFSAGNKPDADFRPWNVYPWNNLKPVENYEPYLSYVFQGDSCWSIPAWFSYSEVPQVGKTQEILKCIHTNYANHVYWKRKARAFLTEIEKFIKVIGQPLKVSEWEGAEIQAGDVDVVTKMIMESMGNQPFGVYGCATEEVVKTVMEKVIV